MQPRDSTNSVLMCKKVTGHEATPSGLAEALKGAEIVLIPAGVPRKPGMTRDGRH
jgi:malate/lactate dehydrogenase